jgi:hypothetical protein
MLALENDKYQQTSIVSQCWTMVYAGLWAKVAKKNQTPIFVSQCWTKEKCLGKQQCEVTDAAASHC